jgi:phosphoribosylglycinamide formyltransferase-1
VKFGFYVSRNAARFRTAVQQQVLHAGNTAFALVDYGEAPVLAADCERHNIPLYRRSYDDLGLHGKARNRYISDIFRRLLDQSGADYGVLMGGRLILEGDILAAYDRRLINFHPSLLPAYKGSSRAVDEALADRAMLLGNSAHFVNERVDDGPVLMQSILPMRQYAGYDSVLDLQVPMLRQIIRWAEQGRFEFDGSGVHVRDATYVAGPFVPAIEV